MKGLIKRLLREGLLDEVRYVNPMDSKETSLGDSEVIRVYHGFNKFDDVEEVLKNGLSGKDRAKRIFSYEAGNNPKGLFVSVDFKVAKDFGGSGVVIEFSTKVSDLEAPVWVGGRSYFVQGEYTESFKDLDEREQQRLINRQKAGESPYDYISKSDRPELATTIFDNPERQALYIGDLNPNMIKAVWYNEVLHKDRRINGEWVRLDRKAFIKKLGVDTKRNKRFISYLPNDDFNFDEFVKKYYKGDYNNSSLLYVIDEFITAEDYELREYGFWPKQIKQIMQMRDNGEFDKYVK